MRSAGQPRSSVAAWCQLLRLPNLLTVPGDVVAGYLLALGDDTVHAPSLAAAAGASVLFYAGGLLVNDIADAETDARERPRRPLPSGAVTPLAAGCGAAALLAAGGVLACVLGRQGRLIGLALLFSVLLYDLGSKSIPYLGALNMGICRGLSLLLGAAATPSAAWDTASPLLAFDILVLYVAAITHLARGEMSPERVGGERWAPGFVLAAGFALLTRLQPLPPFTDYVMFLGAFVLAGMAVLAVADAVETAILRDLEAKQVLDVETRNLASVVPHMIELLLSSLLLLQAGLVSISGAGQPARLTAIVLLGLWPVHRIVNRRFYAS